MTVAKQAPTRTTVERQKAQETVAGEAGEDGVYRNTLLPPGPSNPRNSEGDFVQLNDGRLMFVYSHFTSGGGKDDDRAHLAARFSFDHGRTWTNNDLVVVPNEGRRNVMSVSLLRTRDDEIALIYCVKNAINDCRPVIRVSSDEGRTWSPPRQIIPETSMGYYVMNNDRVVQLQQEPFRGRLIAPLSFHGNSAGDGWSKYGAMVSYLSDDMGRTWRRATTVLKALNTNDDEPTVLQEPGVVELSDRRIMMFMRTEQGRQYAAYSDDGGEHWGDPQPTSITSPCSPASIKRIPLTGDLLLVWNDHYDPEETGYLGGFRTPLNAALSTDEGRTWRNHKALEDDPFGWYCCTAIEIVEDQVVLGHCAGSQRTQATLHVQRPTAALLLEHNPGASRRLGATQITSFPVDWLYA